MERKESEHFSEKLRSFKQEESFQWISFSLGAIASLMLFAFIFQELKTRGFQPESLRQFSLFLILGIVFAQALAGFIIIQLRKHWFAIEQASSTDPVTGIANRLQFEKLLEEELRRGGRYHYSISLCYLDLDGFRSFIEQFGEEQGDFTLSEFAKILQASVRYVDCVARYQDDEFCVLLPHTDIVGAEKFLSRLQLAVENKMNFDFSGGVTSYQAGESKAQFLARAFSALKQAKSEGSKKIRYVLGDAATLSF